MAATTLPPSPSPLHACKPPPPASRHTTRGMPPHRPRCLRNDTPTHRAQLAPPHCRPNQHHHCCYPSHCHAIKIAISPNPSSPCNTDSPLLLFYKPARARHTCSQDTHRHVTANTFAAGAQCEPSATIKIDSDVAMLQAATMCDDDGNSNNDNNTPTRTTEMKRP